MVRKHRVPVAGAVGFITIRLFMLYMKRITDTRKIRYLIWRVQN